MRRRGEGKAYGGAHLSFVSFWLVLTCTSACDVGYRAIAFDCADDEAPGRDGACEVVGVPPADCLGVADGRGGCLVELDEPCEGLALPGAPCESLCPLPDDTERPGFIALPETIDTPIEQDIRLAALPRRYVAKGVGNASPCGDLDAGQPACASIADAVAQASALAAEVPLVVVIGAGVFEEAVRIERPIVLVGACPHRTTLRAPSGEVALTIGQGVADSGAGAMTISSAGRAVEVGQGAKAGLQWARVESSADVAVVARAGATLVLQDLQVWSEGAAVEAQGASLWVIDSELRAGAGPGLRARAVAGPTRPKVTVERSVITGHLEDGILIEGGSATVTESLVRGPSLTTPAASGRGIAVTRSLDYAAEAELTLTRSVIERSRDAGIDAFDAVVSVDRSVIRDTLPRSTSSVGGAGCAGQAMRLLASRPLAAWSVRHSVLERQHTAGLLAAGAPLSVSHSIVRDTARELCSEESGDGVQIYPGAPLELDTCRVETSARGSVVSFGEEAAIDAGVLFCGVGNVVRESHGQRSAGEVTLGEQTLCACHDVFARCEVEAHGYAPWLAPP